MIKSTKAEMVVSVILFAEKCRHLYNSVSHSNTEVKTFESSIEHIIDNHCCKVNCILQQFKNET